MTLVRHASRLVPLLLSLATAAVILWQNAHLTVLWDFSYVLDSAWRFALGQPLYRTLPFAHAPLTFLLQAALIRLFGRVAWHAAAYAAISGALATYLATRLLIRRSGHGIGLLLAFVLLPLGVYCILPHPSYDCDCGLALVVALCALERASATSRLWPAFFAGACLALPVFIKQNIGLPLIAATFAALALLIALRPDRHLIRAALALLAGSLSLLLVAALVIQSTVGLSHYLHWTIAFAAARRLPGIGPMLSMYADPFVPLSVASVLLGYWLIRRPQLFARAAALLLLAAPLLWTLSSLVRFDDADERGDALLGLWPVILALAALAAVVRILRRRPWQLADLAPLVVLATIHGTMLSQQLWGSTYAIWPLFLLLLADLLCLLPGRTRIALTATAATTLVLCGAFYTVSEERLSYVDLPGTAPHASQHPALAGLHTPGPYLHDFDQLLSYTRQHIPADDAILLLPGEDPFYFATGRTPRFPVLLFDPATDPYTPDELVQLVRQTPVRWLIVKRRLQIRANPTPQLDETLTQLSAEFRLVDRLDGYDVYRR